jgi:hypothetical protein
LIFLRLLNLLLLLGRSSASKNIELLVALQRGGGQSASVEEIIRLAPRLLDRFRRTVTDSNDPGPVE